MYCLNESKMFYDLADNQAIIIDSSTGFYYALNMLGSMVFDYLAKGASSALIRAELQKLPQAPPDAPKLLEEFEAYLLRHEILLPAEQAVDMPIAFAAELAANGFALEIEQFNDAQEIMLADPVHDVDLETGWPFLKQPEQ